MTREECFFFNDIFYNILPLHFITIIENVLCGLYKIKQSVDKVKAGDITRNKVKVCTIF